MSWFIEYEGGLTRWWHRNFLPCIGNIIMNDSCVISACSRAYYPYIMPMKSITREEAEEMWPVH